MKKVFTFIALLVCGFLVGDRVLVEGQERGNTAPANAQSDPSITPNGVIGEVTAVDVAAKQVTVKTDAGGVVIVVLSDATAYMRVPPGVTTLDKATKISLAEVGMGDRVFARGRVSDDRKAVMARMIVINTKADLNEKQERERAEWRRRGLSGTITALNPQTKEITINSRGREAATPVVIDAAKETVRFRRYAPGSVKFTDAKRSSFNELKVGDQLRALGERSPDGQKFTAEEIVAGSFRTIGGTITAIDPQKNEIKINDMESRQTLTIDLNKDSAIRRIPPEILAIVGKRMMGGAQQQQGSSPGGPQTGGSARSGQPSGGGEGARTGAQRPPDGGGGGQGGPGGTGGPRMMGGGSMDFQDMIERLPALTIADLKPGDMIVASSATGKEPTRVTGINLVTGLEALFKMMQSARGAGAAGPAFNPVDFGSAINLGNIGEP